MDALRERILAAARREPAPTRRELRRRHLLVLTAAAALSLALFAVEGGVRLQPRPTALVLLTALGAAALAAPAAWWAVTRGSSMLGRPARTLAALLVLLPAALFLWKVAVSSSFAGMTREWVERVGVRCLGVSLSTALPLLGGLVWTRRHLLPSHPALRGAALGLATGGWSWLLVDLWCPVAYVPHLVLGHVLPMVLLCAVGAAGGARWLRPAR